MLLCPIRTLKCYLDQTRWLLFIFYKLGYIKDIRCFTILSWIKNSIKCCYSKVDNADMYLIGVKAHDVRRAGEHPSVSDVSLLVGSLGLPHLPWSLVAHP